MTPQKMFDLAAWAWRDRCSITRTDELVRKFRDLSLEDAKNNDDISMVHASHDFRFHTVLPRTVGTRQRQAPRKYHSSAYVLIKERRKWRPRLSLESSSLTCFSMRRAVQQVLRLARRPLRAPRNRNLLHSHGAPPRPLLNHKDRIAQMQLLPSSMYFRNFSVALVSTLVASGAYFAYRGGVGRGPNGELVVSSSPLSGPAFTRSITSGAALSAKPSGSVPESLQAPSAEAQATRKALVSSKPPPTLRRPRVEQPLTDIAGGGSRTIVHRHDTRRRSAGQVNGRLRTKGPRDDDTRASYAEITAESAILPCWQRERRCQI